MKALLHTEDLLVGEFLCGLLEGLEGLTLVRGAPGEGTPDGAPGWVLLTARRDVDSGMVKPGSLTGVPWISGVVVFVPGGEATDSGDDVAGVVTIRLPARSSTIVEALSAAGKARPAARTDLASIRVLVAEDSDMQRQILVSNLKAEGLGVDSAVNGRDALALARKGGYDILVTDVEMPHMSGLELTRAVRADPALSEMPILMLTTLAGFEQVKEGFDAGASDYLVKPHKGERELFLEEVVHRVYGLLQKNRAVGSKRALVVDDSQMTRRLVAGAMKEAGFAVTTAEDGLQAREYLENPGSAMPDIVVTDLEMPVMDGLRLTHFIKNDARLRDLPVVILSGTTEHEHRVLGRGFGSEAFISKPFSEEKLLVTVEQVLSRRRLEKERRELSKILGRDVIRAVHKGGLEPRRRRLTIMFSDIAGFSTMCFDKDAGAVVDLLNDYFDQFVEYVLREQGYVNKFIGDALVALFSSLPGLDPPEIRAVRAAADFQRHMAEVVEVDPDALLTRVGINTGEVIMGLIGSGERKDYTVIGDQVNRAQRFEGQAPVGGLLISEETHRGAASYLTTQSNLLVEEIDDLQLKGIGKAVTGYAVTVATRAASESPREGGES